MRLQGKPLLLGIAVIVLLVVVWRISRTAPIAVDVVTLAEAPMRVTVEEEGEVHAHDRYMVTAPITGRLLRIGLHEGDAVKAGDVVASLMPLPVSSWQKQELEARLTAAIARQREARADVTRTQLLQEQAERERARSEQLLVQKLISQQVADDAVAQARAAAEVSRAARQRVVVAEAEVAATRASLAAIDVSGNVEPVKLSAPVDGQVLNVIEQNERVLSSGAPIVLLGDPSRLEARIELLSTDAVNVSPGMAVELFGWGGAQTLTGRVRTVEPAAFTKISSLGVEEQRVRVIADIDAPPPTLGDGYHVEARILVWQSEAVLPVPVGALFRNGDGWAVFRVDGDVAVLTPVELGQRNREQVQVLAGLSPGQTVVVYPPSDLQDGGRIRARPTG